MALLFYRDGELVSLLIEDRNVVSVEDRVAVLGVDNASAVYILYINII